MKNSTYLIILLALGLAIVSYKWISTSTESAVERDAPQNTTLEDIMTRTSVRSYTEQTVSRQQVDTLLRTAMAAPTAGNKQPWRFVVIDEKSTLKHISENFPTMTMAEKAPVAIVMCGDTTATFPGDARDYWIQDVSAASENLLLAAHSIGLGAVWCGIYPQMERVKEFSHMLRLPAEIIPMACICVGYPQGQQTPKDKWNPQNVHYNTW